jgi:hypothetical protein
LLLEAVHDEAAGADNSSAAGMQIIGPSPLSA